MNKNFELALIIDAPIEVVFALFSDPEGMADATGIHNVHDLTKKPATVGTTWTLKNGWLGNTNYRVIAYEKPYRLVKSLTGNLMAEVEDVFENNNGQTKVTRIFTATKLPWFITVDGIREQQRSYMNSLKTYLERNDRQTSDNEDEIVKRVKCSVKVGPSPVMKRRKQTTIAMETFIAADRELVFDVVISQVDHFWQWMEYRSDQSGLFDISPDWPKQGSEYQYRIRVHAGEPLSRWETGIVSMLECEPPAHAFLKEVENAGKSTDDITFVDWKFESVKDGTLLSVRYDLTIHNFFMNALFSQGSFGLEKSIANIIKICENNNRSISNIL